MYKIFRTRKVLPIPCIWNGISQTSLKTKKIHGAAVERQWNFYTKKGDYTGIDFEREWNNTAESIVKRLLNNSAYLQVVYKKQLNLGSDLIAASKKILKCDLNVRPLKKLLKDYEQIQTGWLEYDRLNVTPWLYGGDLFQNFLKNTLLRNHRLTEKEFAALVLSPKLSFSSEEEMHVLELVFSVRNSPKARRILNRDPNKFTFNSLPKQFQSKIKKLVSKYYWIPFGYDGPSTYDDIHYLKVVHDELKKKVSAQKGRLLELRGFERTTIKNQAKIFSERGIPKNIKKLIGLLHLLNSMTDQRKEVTFQAHIAFQKIIEAMSDMLNMPIDTFKYLTLEELKPTKSPKSVLKIYKRRRKNDFFVYFYRGKYRFIENRNSVKKLKTTLLPELTKNTTISGAVASKGHKNLIKGKVKILLQPKDMIKFNRGEILMTQMTTPEFVPAMRKAAAIVTDEGGVTSHAAIVSRELGITCVIGTKIATRVFKDGDLVEVDANKGTVKRISK